mgnify:CR=1 FL=1
MTPMQLIQADLFRFGGETTSMALIKALLGGNRSFKYTFWLRMCRSQSLVVRLISRYMHRHLSIKYQIQIPKETEIGPGLYLGHATTIVVSSTAVIGRNCNLSHFVSIGSNHGKAATLGNNVYVGPHVCLVEDVSVGDNVTIGAGSIVIKSIPVNMTAVGNPARVINHGHTAQYISNPFNG